MKKILLPILTLALVFTMSYSVSAERTLQEYLAIADFYDYNPGLVHEAPRITRVISCNMVLKPRTEAHLSRLCDSAVANVKYYLNDETNNVRKGPDYTNIVEDEIFYPASRQLPNSCIGGMVSYKVGCDFQTKKTNGEKVYLEVPVDVYQSAIVISSITKRVDLGYATTVSVETGDQSQPNWVGTSGVFEGFEGTWVDWTFDFGYIDDSGVSGAFGLLKSQTKNVHIITLKGGTFNSSLNGGQILFANSGTMATTLNDDKKAIVSSAKRLYIKYNENAGAVDSQGNVVVDDGWQDLSPEDEAKFVIQDDGNISYPSFMNAWIRIDAVTIVPSADDCKPVRRTVVKGRIGTKYPGFEFKNMKEGDVLKIYNVNGKKIREVTSGSADGFVWDGKNDSGDWAKSGIYIYQIKVDGKIVSGTIAFVY